MMAAELKLSDRAIVPGSTRELFQTGMTVMLFADQYAVTADGQRFLVLKPVDPTVLPPITVVFNWPESLKQ
jgi:hypothetical protein